MQKSVHLNEELTQNKQEERNEMWFVENNIGATVFSDFQSNQKLIIFFLLIYLSILSNKN